jgi:hypothetical protein
MAYEIILLYTLKVKRVLIYRRNTTISGNYTASRSVQIRTVSRDIGKAVPCVKQKISRKIDCMHEIRDVSICEEGKK